MLKDVLRPRLVRFFQRFFAICTPSERCSIAIDIPGLGNRGGPGGARVVLEYEGETG